MAPEYSIDIEIYTTLHKKLVFHILITIPDNIFANFLRYQDDSKYKIKFDKYFIPKNIFLAVVEISIIPEYCTNMKK